MRSLQRARFCKSLVVGTILLGLLVLPTTSQALWLSCKPGTQGASCFGGYCQCYVGPAARVAVNTLSESPFYNTSWVGAVSWPGASEWDPESSLNDPRNVGYLRVETTVPAYPAVPPTAALFVFPALQMRYPPCIYQPLLKLDWLNTWTMKAVRYCADTDLEEDGPVYQVFPGDKIVFEIAGGNCSTANRICTTWRLIATDVTRGYVSLKDYQTRFDSLGGSGALVGQVSGCNDGLIGMALEEYGVNSCSQLPSNGSIWVDKIVAYRMVSGPGFGYTAGGAMMWPRWMTFRYDPPLCNIRAMGANQMWSAPSSLATPRNHPITVARDFVSIWWGN